MNDMTAVIAPKSDQLNADDLIPGPRTIQITEVTIRPGTEQPVSIHFEGDNGKPWKTCKSMNKVLVFAWGPDANVYKGRWVTIYRDPSVKWGGMEVGGIRISHLSHIDGPQTLALTMTKGSKKPYKVLPLKPPADEAPAASLSLLSPSLEPVPAKDVGQWVNRCERAIAAITDPATMAKWRAGMEGHFGNVPEPKAVEHVQAEASARMDELADAAEREASVSE